MNEFRLAENLQSGDICQIRSCRVRLIVVHKGDKLHLPKRIRYGKPIGTDGFRAIIRFVGKVFCMPFQPLGC